VLFPHDQPARLLPGAPEGVTVSAYCIAGEGWRLKISVRRQFQTWHEASTGAYERLTTDELVDVIEAELVTELLERLS